MATKRPSVQKREREQIKRQRQADKAARAAARAAEKLAAASGEAAPGVVVDAAEKDEKPC